MENAPRKRRKSKATLSAAGVKRWGSSSSAKTTAWLLRAGFVVALLLAVWLTRPTEPTNVTPGPVPIASNSPPGGGRPEGDSVEPDQPDSEPNAAGTLADDEATASVRGTDRQPSQSGDLTTERAAPESAQEAEIRWTLERIEAGGPYPYRQDDTVFFNREGRLPKQPLGYYREFTVKTPGADDRGPRRIVRGERGELYYTDDHYRSFVPLDGRPGAPLPDGFHRNNQPRSAAGAGSR